MKDLGSVIKVTLVIVCVNLSVYSVLMLMKLFQDFSGIMSTLYCGDVRVLGNFVGIVDHLYVAVYVIYGACFASCIGLDILKQSLKKK